MLFGSIDTLHVIYYNYTVEKIFKHLSLPTDNFKEMYQIDEESGQCKNISNRGYKYEFKLNYNDIWFHCDCLRVNFDSLNCDNFFTFAFDSIRVEFTGQGIEFLRSRGFSPDDTFINLGWWSSCCTRFNITRVDFAFDYVNDKADCFTGIYDYVDNFQLSNRGVSRLFTGKRSGISFERKYGTQDTLYLGSKGSDKLLRIYDKKRESEDKLKLNKFPLFMKDKVKEVQSWFRVELQLRRNYCHHHLFDINKDLKNNLLFVFDNFFICEKNEDGEYQKIKPMLDLYDWTSLRQLDKMQNTNEVNEYISNLEKAHNHMSSQGSMSLMQIFLHEGPVSIIQDVQTNLHLIQYDEYYNNRYRTLNSRIRSDADFYGVSFNDWCQYLKIENDCWVIDEEKIIVSFLDYFSLGNFSVIEKWYLSNKLLQ